ncbi:hypothetical protein C1645_834974 [Glomus cerebriforme]|uniref:F-box domain-containing protein n=1 Tax=Glomus cerebriforme TaxID=658196 RepID=A0A397SCV2_9GLOM|nr:hypothetical protein C1645_834974 [Glomus cerebriforme]
MSKLNKDVLYLILEEFQDDKKNLCSFLSVNKTWCEIIIPILWKNPWKYLKDEEKFLNVIISHLSMKSKDKLKSKGVNFIKNSYQKPSFNYISFCRHLNLNNLNEIINNIIIKRSEILIIQKVIIKLFINSNTKFTHLYLPQQFDYQIHLIPEAKRCFSELEFLSCNTRIKDDVLDGLKTLCESIKELEFFIEEENNNYGIVKLVEIPRRLLKIRLLTNKVFNDKSFCKILENSLIRHAFTTQHFKIIAEPITELLLSFKNLRVLELGGDSYIKWDCLKNLSLPFIQILRARRVPIQVLTSLIKNTSGTLIEIKINYISHDVAGNKRIIQTIYQKCPNLRFLLLLIRNNNIAELKNLLINCQHLEGLCILADNSQIYSFNESLLFNWNSLFNILVRSSPTSLFKFKFCFQDVPKMKYLNLFFYKWKSKHPMLLQTNLDKHFDLIKRYEEKGIIKKHDCVNTFEDFEWN